jgi:hypothetical protein
VLARYFLDTDFDQISKWYVARGKKLPDKSLYPYIGIIVDDVAAGFLVKTETSLGIIDGYISNPESNPKVRSAALNDITEGLIDCAKLIGIRYLKCESQSEAIKKRAIDNGFKSAGMFELFGLEI